MNEKKFRKQNIDKVKSPDNLEDYIRAATPRVWLLMVSVIILLAGAIVWGIFGHVDSTVQTSVFVEDGDAVCFVAEENLSDIKVGMTVKFAEHELQIESIGEKTDNGYACMLSGTADLPDGYYEGKVITESFEPIYFLLN